LSAHITSCRGELNPPISETGTLAGKVQACD
jgi:hypothetical protein